MSCDLPHGGRLVPYPEALALVLGNVSPLPSEVVPLAEALGAWLAEPAVARHHSPRFEQAAMDGYAVRLDDVAAARPDHAVTLTLAGSLAAGDQRPVTLKPGQAIGVFTGSRLPGGTEAVVMKEHVTVADGAAVVAWRVGRGDHIRRVGEEFRRGDEILPAGLRITPPIVGLLALLGRKSIAVGRRPAATVITMGDELVAPGERPGPAQINDANGPALTAALNALGVREVTQRRVPDDPALLREAMAAALGTGGVLLTAGGASVGDHDHVPAALAELGVSNLFSRLAIKPGKPTHFGLGPAGQPVFGLPGNPVSALVAFHQLVKPALVRLMGGRPRVTAAPAVLAAGVAKRPGRLNWVRAALSFDPGAGGDLTATPATGQGSHMLSGLALADALLELAAGSDGAAAGDTLPAIFLDWQG